MSAATTPTTPPPANGTPVSPVEYVRGLSLEDREDVFIALLRELIEANGGGKGLIPIETHDGESLGYYVSPLAAAARAEAYLPKWTAEEDAELARRIANPGPTM